MGLSRQPDEVAVAVTSSSSRTAADRVWIRSPDPCVPVAIVPATEMWPSDAMLWTAQPRSSSSRARLAVPHARRHACDAVSRIDLQILREQVDRHAGRARPSCRRGR